MGINIRKSAERGHLEHDGLTSSHVFSVENYYDPELIGFRALRVIKEDKVPPRNGFPLHSHEDMEIVSLVLEGSLLHQDGFGKESSIQAGQIQVTSAGTGIAHSVYNTSNTEFMRFLQIWIVPDKKGHTPSYGHKSYTHHESREMLIVSPDGQNNSLPIHQDVTICHVSLKKSEECIKTLKSMRFGWIQVIQGDLTINEIPMKAGDGASIEHISHIRVEASTPCEFLFFDLN